MKNENKLYQAMVARDYRFDGKFFVGVKTTGIYCRPICPAKPKRENVEFFPNYLAAEKSGYRPCLRCRPESAPQSPAWIGKSAMVQRAIKMINSQDTILFNEDKFAALFGVSARHLRRVFFEEIGKTPKQLASENRLNLARKLVVETQLPVTEIVYSSGFESIRRFNDAFKKRFSKSPNEIRKKNSTTELTFLKITLSYRPPYDFKSLLKFYKNHAVGELERFTENEMIRIIVFNGQVGKVIISNDPEHCRLNVEIDFPNTAFIHVILSKVRSVFDLDSDPIIIANSLETDPQFKKILKKYPGVRLPSGWEPFEVAISTILGQLVSVDRGRRLVADLIEMLGEDSGLEYNGKKIKLFPSPLKISESSLEGLKTTKMRKATLKAFAKAVENGSVSLKATQSLVEFYSSLKKIKGIGPWTSDYMALKVIRNADAFPKTDLILARALEEHPIEAINKMGPWRGYAAVLMWLEYHQVPKK